MSEKHRDRIFSPEIHFVETAQPGTTYELEVSAGSSLRVFLVPIHLTGRIAVRSATIAARVDLAEPANTVVPYGLAIYQVQLPRPAAKPSSEPSPTWRAKLRATFPSVQASRSVAVVRLDTFLRQDVVLDPRDGIFMVGFHVRSADGTSYLLSPQQTDVTAHRASRAKEFSTAIGVFPETVTMFDLSVVAPYICLRSAVGAIVFG